VCSHGAPRIASNKESGVASLIGLQELLVGYWDGISNVYGYGWSVDGRFISFPTEAVVLGFDSVAQL
jgi:hypothetical protein